MKKIICTLLACVLICSAYITSLTGCDKGTTPKKNASDLSSEEFIPHKFGKSDLVVNGNIKLGMTVDEVKDKLGTPDSDEIYTQSQFIYGPYRALSYDDLELTFYDVSGGDNFTLGIISSSSPDDIFAGGLHAGSSLEDAFFAFTKSEEAHPLYFDHSEESYGDYIYGTFNQNLFLDEKPKGEIQYAYVNKWAIDNGYSDEYMVEYYYFNPLIWNEDETGYEGDSYSLVLYMDKESDLVKSIMLSYDCYQ